MREMTSGEMVEFLRDLNMKKAYLAEEKTRIGKSVETLDEAIRRNTFSRKGDDLGIMNGGCNTYKILRKAVKKLVRLYNGSAGSTKAGAEGEAGKEEETASREKEEDAATVSMVAEADGSLTSVLPADAPQRREIDWTGLTKINADVIGWIDIPAIEVSYPVLQAEDNEYYLHRDIHQEYLFAGSIFMDSYNSPDLSNYNTMLYGHNMRDGSMFAKIRNFRDEETLKSCRYFWIYTPEADYLYEICSIHYAAVGSDTYTVRFNDYDSYIDWLGKMQQSSDPATGVELAGGDRIVTLSTCTTDSSTRTVVQGKLVWRSSTAL